MRRTSDTVNIPVMGNVRVPTLEEDEAISMNVERVTRVVVADLEAPPTRNPYTPDDAWVQLFREQTPVVMRPEERERWTAQYQNPPQERYGIPRVTITGTEPPEYQETEGKTLVYTCESCTSNWTSRLYKNICPVCEGPGNITEEFLDEE